MDKPRLYYTMRPGEMIALLESATDNGGAYSRFETKIQPGITVPPHYHRAFEEHFEVLEGELALWEGRRKIVLSAGQDATVAKNVVHRWKNQSDHGVTALVTITPGHAAFEQWLKIFAGLKRDGQLTANGLPKSPYVMGCFMEISDTRFSGPAAVMGPLFRWLYSRARSKGLEEQLLARYCR